MATKTEENQDKKPSFEEFMNGNNNKNSSKNASKNGQQKTANRTRSSATSANNQIQEKIANARNAVRKNTKAQIILGGISDALHDIAVGNFDDLELDALGALDEFTACLEEAHDSLILMEAVEVPKLLSASDTSFREGELN